MSEQSWKPLFRSHSATVTRALRSPAFLHSRRRAEVIVGSPAELRALADAVERLDYVNGPLSAVADRVLAAVRLLRSIADRLDSEPSDGPVSPAREPEPPAGATASSAARERLVVAGLHYLVMPDDLVPDFRPGGYVDDALLLSWVFGAAVHELEPHLPDDPDLPPSG